MNPNWALANGRRIRGRSAHPSVKRAAAGLPKLRGVCRRGIPGGRCSLLIFFLLSSFLILDLTLAQAHEVRPARLDVTETAPGRYLVQWKVPAMGEQPLPIEPEFGQGCEEVAEQARGSLAGTAARTYEVRCGEGLAGTEIFFRNLATTLTDVLVQVRLLDGAVHTGLVRPGDPVFRVPAREARPAIFGDYFRLGVEHILMGWDHLLFVLGMLLLVPDLRRLVGAVTGFTVAHSLTLGLAALDVVHVPGPPVEAVVALSLVLLAAEARRYDATGEATLAIRRPWLVSMAVGLVHGLGFAGALVEFGLPAHARLMSLFAFNVGVEAGQLGFIAVVAPAGLLARRMRPGPAAWGRHAALWGVGIAGSVWLVQRLVGFVI